MAYYTEKDQANFKGNDSNNITCRLAREEDHSAVIEVCKTEGTANLDYVPGIFLCWVAGPFRTVSIAELNGKIVGVLAARVMDSGTSLLIEAARTKLGYRKRGVYSKLKQHAYENMLRKYPTIKREVFVIQILEATRKAEKVITEVQYFALHVKKEELSPKLGPVLHETEKLIQRSVTEIKGIVFDVSSAVCEFISPSGLLLVNNEPFEIMSNNAEELFDENDRLFTEKSPAEPKDVFPKSLSHGRCFPTKNDHRWFCSIYTADPDLLRAHVLRHLAVAMETFDEDFFFTLSCLGAPDSLISRICYDVLVKEFGLARLPDDCFPYSWAIIEKQMPNEEG